MVTHFKLGILLDTLCTPRIVKLLLSAALLLFISFYVGSLFGNREIKYKEDLALSSDAAEKTVDRLPNTITLSLRPEPIHIPSSGMYICPANFTEYIPCHDENYIRSLSKSLNFTRREHLERHCPPPDERPFCLIPPPKEYKLPIKWPESKDFVWRSNVNHTRLAEKKGGQNWVHINGSRMWFPGGGTHFKHGASEYIQRLGNMITNWKGNLQTAGVAQVLDVGCGVASFAAYLLPLKIQTMSFAPIDGHENQIQFALERGIAAVVAVLGTKRLPYPSKSFDAVHCSRCRVDWHEDGGILLKEMDRLLRPGGYFIYSAPPAYRKDKEFPAIWNILTNITNSMCWELISQHVQTAIWQKTADKSCQLQKAKSPGSIQLCDPANDLDKSWNKPLDDCIALSGEDDHRFRHLPPWPARLMSYSKHLEGLGVTLAAFQEDTVLWQKKIEDYWKLLDVSEKSIRNVMDMNALYGGFGVALRDKPVWVMNVVPSGSKNTLSVIYDRGLIGTFHDWCEPFASYPRTYDLLHAYRVISLHKKHGKGCQIADLMLEMDRLLRPNGIVIVRDSSSVIQEMVNLAPKFLWVAQVHDIFREGQLVQREQLLVCRKQFWIVE